MDNTVYKITLADGTVLDNLKLNGNNFISSSEVTESTFDDNLSSVTISHDDETEIHSDMELIQIKQYAEHEYWFIISDISAEKLEAEKQRSDLEYIAMMTGVEL